MALSFFKRRNKDKDKAKNKPNKFTSAHSVADAVLFPEQYSNASYDLDSFPDELLFIPYAVDDAASPVDIVSYASSATKLDHTRGVAALLIHGSPQNSPSHFMIVFHGNGVDLGMASAIYRPLIRALPIHLLIVEYPGYGVMTGRCSCQQVVTAAERVHQYVTSKENGLGISASRLLILGQSIGTGPASHIAKYPCSCLILVSPFTSIHDLSAQLIGKWTTSWMLPKSYQPKHSADDADVAPDVHVEFEVKEETQTQKRALFSSTMLSSEDPPILCRSSSDGAVQQQGKRRQRRDDDFVFDNLVQIEPWNASSLLLFHGKNDELIPYSHSDLIEQTVRMKKPEIETKKFLMEGVGHNDVSLQFIGLRIFMHLQELQESEVDEEKNIDIASIVPYLSSPPHFDMATNRVRTYHKTPLRGMKLHKSVSSNIFGDDDNDEDIKAGGAIKVYDLAQQLKHSN